MRSVFIPMCVVLKYKANSDLIDEEASFEFLMLLMTCSIPFQPAAAMAVQ